MRISTSLFRRSTTSNPSSRNSTATNVNENLIQNPLSKYSLNKSMNSTASNSPTRVVSLNQSPRGNRVAAPAPTSVVAPAADDFYAQSVNEEYDDTQELDLEGNQQQVEEMNQVDDFTTFMYLCDHEKGFPLMLLRVKQAMNSSKEAATFMKKKAQLDEEYGVQLAKLVQQFSASEDGKTGTFRDSWGLLLQQHEQIAKDKVALAENIRYISDELQSLQQTTEKSRKQIKNAGNKLAKKLADAEQTLEKLCNKYELANEDWERSTQQLQQFSAIGFTNPVGAHGYPIKPMPSNKNFTLNFNKSKSQPTAYKLQRQEDDSRSKVLTLNESLKNQIGVVTEMKSDYYKNQLPKLIAALKDINSDVDGQLKDRILEYASVIEDHAFDETIKTTPYPHGGIATSGEFGNLPPANIGFTGTVNLIDNGRDFIEFIDSPSRFSNMVQPGPKDQVQSYGKSLNELMDRDVTPVPVVLEMLLSTVEQHSNVSADLYRKNGNPEVIRNIQAVLDKNPEAGLDGIQYTIYDLTSAIKMFLRRLPDSVIPRHVFDDMIRAARSPDDFIKVSGIHEIVNNLSDAHYATLQRMLDHIRKVLLVPRGVSGNNYISSSQSISYAFGPLLMDQGRLSTFNDATELTTQCVCIETLLDHFKDIFIVDGEVIPQQQQQQQQARSAVDALELQQLSL